LSRYDPCVSDTPYRAPAPTPPALPELKSLPDPYLVAWRRLRWWRLMGAVPFLALVPALVVCDQHGLGSWSALVGACLLIWGVISLVRLYFFTCPRCHGAFFGSFQDAAPMPPDLFVLGHCASCRIVAGTPKGKWTA
jgi:hypothetical protein